MKFLPQTLQKETKESMERKNYSKCSSERLFNIISTGNVPVEDAKIIASILETRFPSPKKIPFANTTGAYAA